MAKVLLISYAYLIYIVIKFGNDFSKYSWNVTMVAELSLSATFVFLISFWKIVIFDY